MLGFSIEALAVVSKGGRKLWRFAKWFTLESHRFLETSVYIEIVGRRVIRYILIQYRRTS